jgi:hypothetical protein
MIQAPDRAPIILSLLEIAAWQFKNLALTKPQIIAGIPSLQRGAVWDSGQVELLWDSILRGFPVGALVVCDRLDTQKTRSGKHGTGWAEDEVDYHLLDGQQRCNAIALGFLDPLQRVQDRQGNLAWPPATLWIDLTPEPPNGSTRQFLLRVLTLAHPWGYNANDNASFLGVSAIREAIGRYPSGKRPEIVDAWPHVSKTPVPFSWLMDAAINKQLVGNEFWKEILARCSSLRGRFWADTAAALIEGHLDGSCFSQHLARIESAMANVSSFVIVALKVPQNAIHERSLQEESAGTGAANGQDRIHNIEHLFHRLNSAGTELRGEELIFSMVKAYWPVERSFDALQNKAGNKFLPMPGSRLATLSARAALIGCDQYAGKEKLPPSLNVSRIRSLARAQTDANKAEKKRLEEYLGINSGDVRASDLHQNLRLIDEWLLFDNELQNDFGMPPVLRSNLAQDAPDVFLLLLHLAQRARSELGKGEIVNLRKSILGLATSLHWFGYDRGKAVARLYTSHFGKGKLSPETFLGVLKNCIHPPDGESELYKILSPQELDKLIPKAMASDEKLGEWRLWTRIVEWESTPEEREIKETYGWPFLWQVIQSKTLLLYGQRELLSNRFKDFDPSCVNIWEGHNRPWDYDHILTSSTLYNNPRQFRDTCREWAHTIGNLRAWPLEENRSRHDDLANASITSPEDLSLSKLLDQKECDAFSLTWYDIADPAKVATFMNAARSRTIRLYTDWFDSLEIGKLLSD